MAKDLTEALHQLTQEAAGSTTRENTRLPASRTPSTIPIRTGVSGPVATAAAAGGGINSPLTETAVANRVYWSNKTLTSSDGLFTLVIKPIKKIAMTDASAAAVDLFFANP